MIHRCCTALFILVLVACGDDGPNPADPATEPSAPAPEVAPAEAGEETAATPDPSTAPSAAHAPAETADGDTIAVVRNHAVGDRFSLRLVTQRDEASKTTFDATARVVALDGDGAIFDVEVSSIVSEVPPGTVTEELHDVRVAITVDGGSADAVVAASPDFGRTSSMLTQFEMMLGGICQPPTEPRAPTETWGESSYAGVTSEDGVDYVAYEVEGERITCSAKISLADGLSGERTSTFTMALPGFPPSVTRHELEIQRL